MSNVAPRVLIRYVSDDSVGCVGPKKRNGRKGVGTQGRRYARLIMRESEGEKA